MVTLKSFLATNIFLLLLPLVVFAQDVSHIRTFFWAVRAASWDVLLALGALALLVFIWGIIKFLAGGGDEKNIQQGKNMMIWGVLALFVLFSVWGIVALIQTMTGIGEEDPPNTPQTVY